jgi:hypothetical protein
MRPTPGQEDAQGRIHELLAELADLIGPNADGQADYDPGTGPVGKPTLWEHVVVCCWVDDDRQDWVTVIPAAGMLNHHTVGLLRAGLAYGDRYDAVGDEGSR